MKRILFLLGALAALFYTTGCASMHASGKTTTISPWTNFVSAKAAFDSIAPDRTTVGELHELGFNPYLNPNVRILNYLDIQGRFLPNQSVRMEDLPGPVRQSLSAQDKSVAYELELSVVNSQRYGNLCLDVFAFNRKTKETGWNFKALFLLSDGKVVYKLWSGQPNVDRFDQKKRPLGPFQEINAAASISVLP